jgi:hypothetical protein
MHTNSVADATAQIETVRSLEFKDRYVVVDPHTRSISTYKPHMSVVASTADCLGSGADPILGHPVEYVRTDPPEHVKSGIRVATERWLAVDLNCAIMREHLTTTDNDGKVTQFYREAVSVRPGEPPADFFRIPSDYRERGPADVNKELEANGSKALPKDTADKLQRVYDTEKKLN